MSEDLLQEKKSEEESFADLFEAYSQGMSEDLRVGDKLEGKIISVGKENVFVDTGTKIDGVVDRNELLDEKQEFPFREGDVLDLYVVSCDGNEIRLSKTLSGTGNFRAMGEAFRKAVPIEGKVKSECKGGFHVEVMGKRAFCPISQMDLRYVESPEPYVGETFPFLITQLEGGGRNIVVSRRELLMKEREKTRRAFLAEVTPDTELEGRVTKLMPYGAFVELVPGVEGMIHVSEMSWSRTEKPEEVLSAGETVRVKIIGMEEGKRPGEVKLALSMKQMTGDPWNEVESKFRVGDKVRGKVTRCVKFGAFVEVAPGIEGLVHISEMSYRKRVLRTEDAVAAGDVVEVMVKEINVGKRRISLSIKDAEGDPWVDIESRYKVGQRMEGIIEKKERFGYFVSLEPGITGLLPRSNIARAGDPALIDKLAQGEPISIVIERIDPGERRISLAPADRTDGEDWRSFTPGSDRPMGSLGEKLQRALDSKG